MTTSTASTQTPIHEVLDEYAESHQNPTNKLLHRLCIPFIYLTAFGLVWGLPVPSLLAEIPFFNWAFVLAAVFTVLYIRLSPTVAVGMFFITVLDLYLIHLYETVSSTPVWQASLIVFAVAWFFQFIGHAIEGKKPSFFSDIKMLLTGPAWMVTEFYQKWHIRY